MYKNIKGLFLIALITCSTFSFANFEENEQYLSFMITNEVLKKGHIKIKQRSDSRSPYLIIGCNQKNEDFEVMVGNLSVEEFPLSKYNVITSFKDRAYKEIFIPVYKDGKFFLMKKTNSLKSNQLFVYQYLNSNQTVIEFPDKKVFYFNAKSRNDFTEYMNIIVSHCGMKN